MVPTHSWPSRLVLGVLALQLASACTPDPTPPPTTSDTTPPSTRANPPGGNFTASLTVTLTCDDGAGSGCAATYYTTDGSAPSASSPRYSAPVAISKTTTLKYFSVDAAGNAEAAQSQSYVVSVPATDTTPPTVTASPAAGVYTTAQTVTLTCDDGTGSGCGPIHYTTDGSEPTASSPQYSAPLTVSTTTTVRFFATDKAGNASAVASAAYVIDDAGPVTTATPAGGLYNKEQSVTLVCDDGTGSGCAETRYTTDGSAPGASSALYTGPIAISSTTTLKFFSKDKAGNAGPAGSEQYTLDMVAPTVSASPTGGLFRTAPSVTLSCVDDAGGSGCASIHYTTDGSTPTASSATYTSALSFSATTTLKFLAVDNAGNASTFQTETYTLDTAAPTTTAIKAGGAYPDTESVSLVCGDGGGSGCTATYYTTDGSTPTTSSSTYSAPISIAANTTLKFFSVDAAGNEEAVHTETYVIDRIKPTVAATPKGGTYRTAQSVTLTCSDEAEGSGCASIHYTTDGSMPTASSATYTSALTVSANTTLEFLAMDKAGNASTVTTETYVIDTAAPTTTASPKGATYMTEQTITLSCSDGSGTGCDATYYTLDGSEPTTGSTLYTAPFKLSVNTTLKFFSTDKAGNTEPTKTETYSFDPDTTAPTTTASTKGGTYRATQTVTLACSDGSGTGCDATYYTLDGSEPTTGSTVYTAAITVSANTTLKFFSTDKAGNTESTKTETYVIDSAAPTTTATPAGGTYLGTQSITLACSDGSGTGCDATYYTLDGSTPTTGSTVYTGTLSLTASATLKFFSTDKAGNKESVHSETYTLITPASTSAQIAAIRAAADGAISLPVDYAYVTYTKPNTGATTGSSDPAGFFLQAEKTGPAVFVAVDPTTLSPVPQVGDRVSFTATDKKTVNGVVEVDALDTASFKVNSSGDSVEFLRTDVSAMDLATNGGADYESKLISISGTVAAALVSAGTNHVSANLVTVGTPTSNNNLKLRITTAVQDAFDVVQNCSVTVKSPMWRFASGTTTQAQASAWANADLTVLSCPAPKVVSAVASSATTVQVTFDRRIDAASVLSNGSQFTLNNGLVANSATASARQVQLFTSPQVGGSSYQVTVASSVKDLAGSGIDSTANSATFTGYLVAAKLLINEVNPNISSNKDLLELLVVSGGSVNGMTVVYDGTTAALATLPNITVATGDIIVVHFAAGTGEGPASETTSKSQYPKATYANNYDTAWDVNTSTAGLTFSHRLMRVKDSTGATVDAVPFVNPSVTTAPAAYPTYVQNLQAEGLWFPVDCGGVACSTNALAVTVSVDYSGVGTTAAGKSMQRTAGANTRQKSDWVLSTASSFGVANP